jgi:hypothetical protein
MSNEDRIAALYIKSQVELSFGRYETAKKNLEQVLRLSDEIWGCGSADSINILQKLSKAFIESGDLAGASNVLQERDQRLGKAEEEHGIGAVEEMLKELIVYDADE